MTDIECRITPVCTERHVLAGISKWNASLRFESRGSTTGIILEESLFDEDWIEVVAICHRHIWLYVKEPAAICHRHIPSFGITNIEGS